MFGPSAALVHPCVMDVLRRRVEVLLGVLRINPHRVLKLCQGIRRPVHLGQHVCEHFARGQFDFPLP